MYGRLNFKNLQNGFFMCRRLSEVIIVDLRHLWAFSPIKVVRRHGSSTITVQKYGVMFQVGAPQGLLHWNGAKWRACGPTHELVSWI